MGTERPETMNLPVRLTHEEVFVRGRDLANLKHEHAEKHRELEAAEGDWKAARKAMEADIGALESGMDRLAQAIRSGQEWRDVEVYEAPDFKAGVVQKRRRDTDETVSTRPMSEPERQRALFSAEAGGEGAGA